MTMTGGTPYAAPVAPQAPRDTTRTIAIVALVLAGVAVLAQMLTYLVPMLFFGAFGLFGSGFEDSGPWDPGMMGSSLGDAYGVSVPAHAGRGVSAEGLVAVVKEQDAFLGRSVRCEGVPEVRAGALAACRTADAPLTYVVVELDGAGHADLHWYSPDAMMLGPGSEDGSFF